MARLAHSGSGSSRPAARPAPGDFRLRPKVCKNRTVGMAGADSAAPKPETQTVKLSVPIKQLGHSESFLLFPLVKSFSLSFLKD